MDSSKEQEFEETFLKIIKANKQKYFRIFQRKTGYGYSYADFEDVYQEILSSAWESFNTNYDPKKEGTPQGFLWRIANFSAIDFIRTNKDRVNHHALENTEYLGDLSSPVALELGTHQVKELLILTRAYADPVQFIDFLKVTDIYKGNYVKAAKAENKPASRYKAAVDDVGFLLVMIANATNDKTGRLSKIIPKKPEKHAVLARAILEKNTLDVGVLAATLNYTPSTIRKQLKFVKHALNVGNNIIKNHLQ